MTFERILQAAQNSKPSDEQLREWAKRDEENARIKSWDYYHPSTVARSALTGWTGRSLDVDDIRYSHEYAEPGYSNPSKGILFANWNHVSQRVQDILERAGFAIEWQDEWTTCGNCNRALREKPDCYSWQPSFASYSDGETLCLDCLDPEDYLETLEDNPRTALNLPDIDPSQYGYRKVEGDFENGFHPGQNDDPKKIYERLCEAGHSRLLFQINDVAQFDMRFSIWEKIAEQD